MQNEKCKKGKAYVESLIPAGTKILIHTVKGSGEDEKQGKYGRWLADIWYQGKCLNDELVKLGHARYQEY